MKPTQEIGRQEALQSGENFCFAEPGTRVRVHLNLNRPGVFSIKQGGKVVGHMSQILLTDVTFDVGESAQRAIEAGGRKTVHAYVSGTLEELEDSPAIADPLLFERVRYNPRHNRHFVRPCTQKASTAKVALLQDWRVLAAGVRS